MRICVFHNRAEAEMLNREREKLMKKLIEVEMDGQAAVKHVSQLRDLVRKFRQVYHQFYPTYQILTLLYEVLDKS